MAALLMTLVTLVCCTHVLSSPVGAPTVACPDMVPQHGLDPQTDDPPYTLVLSTNQYDPNSEIIVTLEGNDGATFKGFFIQVRTPDAPYDEAILHGTFSEVDGLARNECLDEQFGDGNAITHTNNTVKSSVTVAWTAPPDDRGDLQFRVSVVQEFTIFWAQLQADIITGPAKKMKI